MALAALLLLLAAAAMAAGWWLDSTDFRSRVERQASSALGVTVTLEGLQLAVWPLPGVALRGFILHSNPPLTLDRAEARPAWASLLQGRPEIASLSLQGVVLPQAGVRDLLQKLEQHNKARKGLPADLPENPGFSLALQRLQLDGVRWQSLDGWSSTVAGEVRLSATLQADSADLQVKEGRWQGARLRLQRDEAAMPVPASPIDGAWQLALDIGGGTVRGPLRIQTTGPTAQAAARSVGLAASLQIRDVSVEALTVHRTLGGKLEADVQLSAQAREPGLLAQALRSQTRFTVRDAVLNGIDLAKAVRTVGLSRGGQTRLETLTGQVATQDSVQGRAVQITQLQARSGLLAASGQASISASQQLAGRISVDLPGGMVGVPLVLGGTVAAPEVTLTRGAMLGAAVGTVVMPGVGTGAGAKLGDRLGEGLKGFFGKNTKNGAGINCFY